ncbi:hypothetical protein [Novosphingobium sp.]|uniref:hypothetical protein n=1 Tax=Novosphingobium sp. TaxID=1874826 RepID=UPI0035B3E5A6
MYQLIFRNWKFALLWAIGLTASATAFFERGGGNEQLEARTQQIREQQQGTAAPTGAASPAAAEDEVLADEADSGQTDSPAAVEAQEDEADDSVQNGAA